MALSSELCWKQEQEQLARASAATLDNVRTIALRAAAAWRIEALAAEKGEASKAAFRKAQLAGLLTPDDDEGDEDDIGNDAIYSENPDRGQTN